MEIFSIPLKRILSLEVKKMSELTDTHNIQLTDIEKQNKVVYLMKL